MVGLFVSYLSSCGFIVIGRDPHDRNACSCSSYYISSRVFPFVSRTAVQTKRNEITGSQCVQTVGSGKANHFQTRAAPRKRLRNISPGRTHKLCQYHPQESPQSGRRAVDLRPLAHISNRFAFLVESEANLQRIFVRFVVSRDSLHSRCELFQTRHHEAEAAFPPSAVQGIFR